MSKKRMVFWFLVGVIGAWILIIMLAGPVKAAAPAWKFYVMGVDVSEFRDATAGERLEMTLGGLASLGVHIAGHHIVGNLAGVNVTQVGLLEHFDKPNEWASRGGFLFQNGVNTLLVEFYPSYFTKGFTVFTALELSTYPARRVGYGDFHGLNNGDLEYYLYSTWAAHNLWRLNDGNY